MNKFIEKSQIKRAFQKCSNSYFENATVQIEMARKLIELLLQSVDSNQFKNILEFGCGNGVLSKLIYNNLEYENLFLNDIIDLKETDFKHVKLVVGDIENIELKEKFNLISANAVIQWLNDLPSFFKKMANTLEDNGIFAFSTFGEDNLLEIKELTSKGLNYYTNAKLQEILVEDFEILASFEYLDKLQFYNAIDVLKHLKATGVNASDNKVFWTKTALKNFENEYKKEFCNKNGQLELTYHPIIIIAKKRSL